MTMAKGLTSATLTISKRSGTTFEIVPEKDSIRHFELQKSDYVKLEFHTSKGYPAELGDSVTIDGLGTFKICKAGQKPTYDTKTGGYEYSIQFDAPYWGWNNWIFRFEPASARNEATWSLTDTLTKHAAIAVRNLEAKGLKAQIVIDTAIEGVSDAMYIQYSNIGVMDALIKMAETYDTECWVEGSDDSTWMIYFGRKEQETAVEVSIGTNAQTMEATSTDKEYTNVIYPFGSTRNLPAKYRIDSSQVTLNGVVQRRLMPPAGSECLKLDGITSNDQMVEGIVIFDDIYPQTNGVIASVTSKQETVSTDTDADGDGQTDTETVTIYRFKDTTLKFSSAYIKSGETLQAVFKTGKMAGMTFNLAFNPDGKAEKTETTAADGTKTTAVNEDSQVFEIVRNDTYGIKLPNDNIFPQAGDTYSLIGWDSSKMEDGLGIVSAAEQKLLERAQKYMAKMQTDPNTYTVTMQDDYMYGLDAKGVQNSVYAMDFSVGDKIKLVNALLFGTEGHRESRVVGFEYRLDKPYDDYKLYVGEKVSYSYQKELQSTVNGALDEIAYNGATYSGGGSGNGTSIYVITSNDSTVETDSNVYSAKRAMKDFLSKTKTDSAAELITFLKGIVSKGDIEVNWNFYDMMNFFGAKIGKAGDAYFQSIALTKFLSAPEFIFNRVAVIEGELWQTHAYGMFESVTPDMNGTTQLTTGTASLRLNENEYGTLKAGDICRGIYNDIGDAHGSSKYVEYETDSDGKAVTYSNTTSDEKDCHIVYKYDECGFPIRKGFFTSYFQVVEIKEDNTTDATTGKRQFIFTYKLYDGVTNNFHPCMCMKFAQYGSLNDKSRQNSIFTNTTTQSFIQVMRHVSGYQISSYNIAARYGELEGLKITCKTESGGTTEKTLHGDGLYCQGNIYFGSSIQQLNPETYDDILDKLKVYSIKLTRDNDVAPIDSEGNIIGGIKDNGIYKFYTAIDVRKRDGSPLTYNGADGDTSTTVGEGEYGINITTSNCKATVKDGNIYVTGITNCHDGDATTDDAIDYTEMRKMAQATVDVFIDPEGIGLSLQTTYHLAITHESTPYINADLSNPMDNIVYDTAKRKYIGLPITTTLRMWKGNEQLTLSQLVVNNSVTIDGLTITSDAKTGLVTIAQSSETMDDKLSGTMEIPVSASVLYAGDSYERKLSLKIVKKSGEQYYIETTPKQVIGFSTSSTYEYDSTAISCKIFTTDSDGVKTEIALSELTARGLYLRQTTKYNDKTADATVQYTAAVAPADNIFGITFELCNYDGTTVGTVIDYDSVPILRGGIRGKDGDGFKYIYILSETAPTALEGAYDGTSTTFSDGWVDDQPSVENEDGKRTCWMSYSYRKDGVWSNWSSPRRVSHYGENQFIYIRYASALTSSGVPTTMSETPDVYIGICVTSLSTAPVGTGSYTWSKFQGDPGKDGTAIGGTSSYLHIAWANSSDGKTDFVVEKAANTSYRYMGTYVSTDKADPTDYTLYTWNEVKGDTGDKGDKGDQGDKGNQGDPGAAGADAITIYCLSATECTVAVDVNGKACEDGSAYFSFGMKKGDTADLITALTIDGSPQENTTYYQYTWKRGDTVSAKSILVKANDGNGVSRTMYIYIKTVKVDPVYLDGKSIYDNTVAHYVNNWSQDPSNAKNTAIKYGKQSEAYDHIAYATSSDGSTGFTTGDGSACSYVGKCTDSSPYDPTTYSSYTWTAKNGETDTSAIGTYRKWREYEMGLNIPSGVLLDVEVTAWVAASRRVIVYDQQIDYADMSNTDSYAKTMTSHQVVKTTGTSTYIYAIVAELKSLTNINDSVTHIVSIHIRQFNTTSETPTFQAQGTLQGIYHAEVGAKTSIYAYGWHLTSPDKGQMRRFTSIKLAQEYCNFDADQLTDAEGGKWVDFLGIKGGGTATGYAYYQCRGYHVSSNSYSTYDTFSGTTEEGKWMEVSQQAVGVFGFLIAKNAIIDFLYSQCIRVGEGENVLGGLSAPDDNGYMLWAGAAAGKDAPFSVDKNGKMKSTNAEIKGTITADSGAIGGFDIGSGRIGTDTTYKDDISSLAENQMFLYNYMIGFNAKNRQSILGCWDNYGIPILLRLIDNAASSLTKYGIVVSVTNSTTGNIAMQINGGCVAGMALKTEEISTTKTIDFTSGSVVTLNTSDIVITLPDMKPWNDGHEIKIKRMGSGGVTIKSGISYGSDGTTSRGLTYMACNGTDQVTTLGISSIYDAMTFVYHHNVQTSSNKGCWVQYKHPRDW
jgi:hypothetical protein